MTPSSRRCAASTKRAKVVGRAVQAAWREQIDAVVAPAEPPREIGQRHDLDHGDAEVDEVGQPLDRRPKRANLRERADVQLVDYLTGDLHAAPGAVAPFVAVGVDDH